MTSLERLAGIVCREGVMVVISRGSVNGTVNITMLKETFDGPLVGPLLKMSHLIPWEDPGIGTDRQIMYAVKRNLRKLGVDVEKIKEVQDD